MNPKTFNTGTVSLNYITVGSGKPPLVLLHGTTDHWQHFKPILPLLAQHHQVYALDLRGHGRSGHVPMGYRVIDFADDVATFLHEVVGETAVLVGHSLGGLIGIRVASMEPTAVSALIIEDPPLFLRRATVQTGSPRAYHFFQTLYEGLQQASTRLQLEQFLSQQLPPERTQNLPEMVTRLRQVDPDVILISFNNGLMNGFEIDESLRQIICPTLLLQANPQAGGALLDQDVAAVMALLSKGQHRFVESAGHAIHVDQPELFVQIVEAFVDLEGI